MVTLIQGQRLRAKADTMIGDVEFLGTVDREEETFYRVTSLVHRTTLELTHAEMVMYFDMERLGPPSPVPTFTELATLKFGEMLIDAMLGADLIQDPFSIYDAHDIKASAFRRVLRETLTKIEYMANHQAAIDKTAEEFKRREFINGHPIRLPSECPCDIDTPNCPCCEGGLKVCLVCGTFEAGLDSPCPNREVEMAEARGERKRDLQRISELRRRPMNEWSTELRRMMADSEGHHNMCACVNCVALGYWSADDEERACREDREMEAKINRRLEGTTVEPRESCGFVPPTPGYLGCTRDKGHDGPCAHPFSPQGIAAIDED